MTNNNFTLITLNEDQIGRRLDNIIKSLFPNITNGTIQKSLRSKMIRINKKRTYADIRPELGDVLQVPKFFSDKNNRPKNKPCSDLPKDLIIYEDSDFLLLNKPHGLAVQGGSGTYDHIDKMLESLPKRNGFRPSCVHRLDRDTSGCLLVAKKRHIASSVGKLFLNKEIEKYYLAICYGRTDRTMGIIDIPLIKKKINSYQEKVQIVELPEEKGQISQTIFIELDYNEKENISLMLLKPLTGRTHQIRVHLEALGCPILGDPKYACDTIGFMKEKGLEAKLCLHAYNISFEHPVNKSKMNFKAPLSPHFKKALGFFSLIQPNKIGKDIYEMSNFILEKSA